jgi:hypothetical protein
MKKSAFIFAGLFLFSGIAGAVETVHTIERTASSADRFVRRLIPQMSVIITDAGGTSNAAGSTYVTRNGFTAGALMDLGTGTHLVMESGLLYRQVGASNDNNLFGNTNFNARYLSVPLAAKFYFGGQEVGGLYLKAGVMGSALLGSDTSYSAGALNTTNVNGQQWNLSAIAGVGLKTYLTAGSDLVLEAGYLRDLTSVYTDQDVYNASYAATAGLSINL